MDTVAKVWNVEKGAEIATLKGHTAEVIAVQFSNHGKTGDHVDGRTLLTGSFDHTACLWDVTSALRIQRFVGHTAEVAAATCSFNGNLIATASMDRTVKVSSPLSLTYFSNYVRQLVGNLQLLVKIIIV